MKAFAALLTSLIYTRSRNAKLDLIARYLQDAPDPDRGWALAALTGNIDFPAVKSATVRGLITERVDPVLFRLSRDYVGDTAETVSLLWPEPPGKYDPPTLAQVVEQLQSTTRAGAGAVLAGLLDRMDADERFAMLKFATGGMRTGVSARLAKLAFAQAFALDVNDVEEIWHALQPPYSALFDWAAHGGERPDVSAIPSFRPFMLAPPLEDIKLNLTDFAVEWKWDGIRVQIAHVGGETRLFSRGGDDISAAFPDIAGAVQVPGVFDGELLVRGSFQGGEDGGAASFNALQQRLGRKTVSKQMLADYPAFVRLYDILFDGQRDLREESWEERRQQLERLMPQFPQTHFDLSPLIEVATLDALETMRTQMRDSAIEGVMLKRRDSPYVAGRRVGYWYKWKRDPLIADCVLMYAQRGSGKRSSYYSDFTFGCWTAPPDQGGDIVPVGKAYSGFSDDEMKMLDNFVRKNTIARFGPVREVTKSLVLEVVFDSIHASKRHKSGVAMRFPRIARIRTDKPAAEADLVETLKAMIADKP